MQRSLSVNSSGACAPLRSHYAENCNTSPTLYFSLKLSCETFSEVRPRCAQKSAWGLWRVRYCCAIRGGEIYIYIYIHIGCIDPYCCPISTPQFLKFAKLKFHENPFGCSSSSLISKHGEPNSRTLWKLSLQTRQKRKWKNNTNVMYVCGCVWCSQQAAVMSLSSINRLVFVMEAECVPVSREQNLYALFRRASRFAMGLPGPRAKC